MRVFAGAAMIACLGAGGASDRFVYAFTYQSSHTYNAQHAYGVDKMDPGGGGTFYFHNVNQHFIAPSANDPQPRAGTIAVDVVGAQSDGGLIVRVSETPAAVPGERPATCVTYGDTTVVCDPDDPLGPEAGVLLRLFGKGFVDAGRLDAQRHWNISNVGAPGETDDYRIAGVTGGSLEILENGTIPANGTSGKTTVNAKIEYDGARSLPSSVFRSTVEHSRRGAVDETISTQTTLELESSPGIP